MTQYNLKGAGLIYLQTSTFSTVNSLMGSYDTIGFWYTSSVITPGNIYVILFNYQCLLPTLDQYGMTLTELMQDSKVKRIKLLRIKDRTRETLFRSYIYSTVNSFIHSQESSDTIIRTVIEKMATSSRCPLNDYLRLVALIHAIQPSSSDLKSQSSKSSDHIGILDITTEQAMEEFEHKLFDCVGTSCEVTTNKNF